MAITSAYKRQGFTLLEMSIVLVLVSVIAGSVAVIFSSVLKKHQVEQTLAKMETIQQALYEYRVAFNRLPCPADATTPLGNAQFGIAASNMGSCTGGVPAVNFTGGGGSLQDERQGMVPTQTLHLPDDYAFDGWGRRIMYTINRDLTQIGAFNIVNGIDPTTRMSINNAQGFPNTILAGYVLTSYGPNGHGAYPRKGGATRLNAGSVNTDELNNCDCDSSAASTGINGVFVQKDATLNPADNLDAFDDIVMYGTRVDMILQSSMSWSLGPFYTFKTNGLPFTGGPGGINDPVVVGGGACFPAGTMIRTPMGDRRIEQLKPDDEVIGIVDETNAVPVKIRKFLTKRSQILVIETEKGSLRTTRDHPLWMGEDIFVQAGELKPGDRVMMWQDDVAQPVTVFSTRYEDGDDMVFNIEVEEPHTFIADGFVVHNKAVFEKIY
jgi:prepilin-type N-terminal cleavage/methylation domain-containing protein